MTANRAFSSALCLVVWILTTDVSSSVLADEPPAYTIRQITSGPSHHFFGYIGHVQNIPWNASGRHIVALETDFQDRMPEPEDAARIVLLDTQDDYRLRVVDETRGWNPQQGTMLYWNPEAPETQFFFNDRDPATGRIFTVLFDISRGSNGERIREYAFDQTPVGNSGVAQNGGFFLAINYARMARLRPVTGYPESMDWTVGENAPEDDGIHKVSIADGRRSLLVSFRDLREKLRASHPGIDDKALFINHTLWNRDDDRIYFYVRADFNIRGMRLNVPFTIDADGSNLTRQEYVGGHPEWERGHVMIGAAGGKQVLYDTDRREVVGQLGSPESIPGPGGDIALSPDEDRFVNGRQDDDRGMNFYSILSRSEDWILQTPGLPIGAWTSGPLRLDPAPCWNRNGNQILVPAIADDAERTRQMFVITLSR